MEAECKSREGDAAVCVGQGSVGIVLCCTVIKRWSCEPLGNRQLEASLCARFQQGVEFDAYLSFARNVDDHSWICTEPVEVPDERGDHHVGAPVSV